MDHAPTASVIILGYNGKGFLPGCLSSVLDQTYPAEAYEVLYADNASSDGSAEWVAREFPTVRLLRFDRNWGFCQGNNRAAEQARGRYLVFLNQDMVVHRHWLAEFVGTLEANPSVKAAHAAGLLLHEGYLEREAKVGWGYISEVSRYGAVHPARIPLGETPIPTLHIGGGCMILDRQVIDELGYIFDPTFFAYGEDLDLGLRLNGLGHGVVCVPTAIGYHDYSGQASPSRRMLRRTALAIRNRFLAYMKNMHADEFLLALPFLFLGSVVKMQTLVGNPVKQALYGLALVPFTAACLVDALGRMPRYARDRRRILRARSPSLPRYWLFHELEKRRRQPNGARFG